MLVAWPKTGIDAAAISPLYRGSSLSLHFLARRDLGAIDRIPVTVLRLNRRLYFAMKMSGALVALWACAAGCALFETGGWRSPDLGISDNNNELLEPIENVIPQALRLEYQIIQRPTDDPLMGEILWDQIVEMGLFKPNNRRLLNEAGIRVGVASNPPPAALDKLLGNLSEFEVASTANERRKHSGHVITLPDGGHVDAQTGRLVEQCTTKILVDGQTKERDFKNARGVIVVTAHSAQDGWARVTFAPEIRYGDVHTVPVAGTAGWGKWDTGQSVHKLPKQQFELTLLKGDTVVITALGESDNRIGDLFFRTKIDGVTVQRMLVVKLLETNIAPKPAGE